MSRSVIRVRLLDSDAWDRPVTMTMADDQGPWRLRVRQKDGVLNVTLAPEVMQLLATADNSGERKLLLTLLQGLRKLLPRTEQKACSESVLEEVVERYAPLGLKKRLITLTAVPPDLNPRGLPPVRVIQEADVEEVDDDLGANLPTHLGPTIGVIPDEQRADVLRKAVGYLFDRLKHLVATLRSDELLELLVTFNEALVRARAWNLLTIPPQLACFSTESEMLEHLQTVLPELATAGVANRFLIEYVAAQPPSGLRPISMDVYDRLMALASQIAGFGMQVDLLQYGLADLTVGLVPAGRLIIARREYSTAMDAYMRSLAAGEIARSTTAYGRRFGELLPDTSAISTAEIDAAAKVEFSLSLTELLGFMVQARILGDDLHPVTPKLPREQFIQSMVEMLGWPVGRVELALGQLSLRPLATFLPPPQPFTAGDVYPWQYNRALSLLRRPFIQCDPDGEAEIIWGPRQLDAASWYLLELCWTGRLHARSLEMQQLMSKIAKEQGIAFNDLVADRIGSRAHLVVSRRVKKFRRLRVKAEDGSNDDLGDIDVLVVNPERHRIWIIDTKNLGAGRTPRELSNELSKMFPQGDGRKRSFIEKHLRRAEWVRNHLVEVVKVIVVGSNIGDLTKWEVQPLIVVDRELVTPFLREPEIPIIAFEELGTYMSDW